MSDAQQRDAIDEKDGGVSILKPTQTKRPDFVSTSARSKKTRDLLLLSGWVSAAIVMVFALSWRMVSSYFFRSPQAEAFQAAWQGSETTKPTSPPTQFAPPIPDAQIPLQPIENSDALTPLLNELAQMNARFDGLEEHITTLKLALQKLATNLAQKQSLAEQPIAVKQQVRQTNSVTDRQQLKHSTQSLLPIKETKQAGLSHPMTAAKRCMDTKQQATQLVVPPALQLKAVLQGRAWLQTSNGASLTVSQGETVAGVGVVKIIDAEQGRIIFSNGFVLR